MPGMDGTGPLGYGPGTGGGFGRCGHGGRNRGRGYAAGYSAAQYESSKASEMSQEVESAPHGDLSHDEKLLAELAEVKERSASLEAKLAELTKMVQRLPKPEQEKSAKTTKSH